MFRHFKTGEQEGFAMECTSVFHLFELCRFPFKTQFGVRSQKQYPNKAVYSLTFFVRAIVNKSKVNNGEAEHLISSRKKGRGLPYCKLILYAKPQLARQTYASEYDTNAW